MKRKIYANALLSDGKILFWNIGQREKDIYDFYKDFIYSELNEMTYFKQHEMEISSMAFEFEDDEESDMNNFIFDVLAIEFFKLYEISEDSDGKPPYETIEK